jgi:hypothetical protein
VDIPEDFLQEMLTLLVNILLRTFGVALRLRGR